MASRLLITSFAGIGKDKIGPLAYNCLKRLEDNPSYPDIDALAGKLQVAYDAYVPAAAIKSPTPTQTAQLKMLRAALNKALTAVARYANDEYPDNEAALLSTGLNIGKQREKHTALEPPTDFKLTDGSQTGTLCAQFKRTRYSVATEVRYTDDPTLPWYRWLSVTTTKNKATLRGYAKKTEVYVMCRAVGGDTDEQTFSEVVSRVVQ